MTFSPVVKDNYFVAFVDILGFKELVHNNQQAKLNQCFNICEQLIKFWNKTDGKNEFKVYNFSDSIVILVPYKKTTANKLFKHLCIALADLQYNLAKNDIWIRGGVSFGEMEIQESNLNASQNFLRLYGKPLIKAYEIESKVARYPRIVIDPSIIGLLSFDTADSCIEAINLNIDYANWKGDVLYRWPITPTRITHDVSIFIDYLDYLFQDFGNSETNKSDNEKFVNCLRKNLYQNSNHYEKYRWVVDYLMSKAESKTLLGLSHFLHYTNTLHKI